MKNKLKFVIPSVVSLIILIIIFIINGIYPFGDNSLIQVDADYQFIPVLYRIYDFLHGSSNIIYDDIGFGNNIYGSMIIQGSIFSPITLLLYFTTRSNIINFYNIIILVKLCLISLTAYIYINKTFKVSEFYKILFSVLWTFSGWVLLNYFNIMWLDSIILFPLIIMFLSELLYKDKYLGYTITLALSLAINYYISYFILLFILFYSFFQIFLILPKDRVKRSIFRLGISTFIAIMLSSFSLIPTLYQTFISSRFGDSGSNVIFYNFMNKSLYLMLSTVFLVIFGKLIFKFKKDKKKIYIAIILFILFSVGVLIEPVNLGIHMGSYWSFPYRYSFLALFILMNSSIYYLEKYDKDGNDRFQISRFIIFLLLGIILVYVNSFYYKDIIDAQIILDFNDFGIYKKILVIFVIMIIMVLLSLSFGKKIFKYMSLSIVSLLQIFIYSSWTIYYDSGYFLTSESNMINDNMDIVNSELGRYKMSYADYTPDYGLIYGVNTLDNWLHILPDGEVDFYNSLGYKTSGTCIRSYGGTIFSDWLFNVKYVIENNNLDDKMYKLLDNYDGYYLSEYVYDSGFGIVYEDNDFEDNYIYDGMNSFELQNIMYRNLFNTDNDIIKIDNYRFYQIDDKVYFEYDVLDYGYLYIKVSDNIDYIRVNDSYINIYGESDYVIDLGVYDKGVAKIEVVEDVDNLNLSLGFIKYDDIMKLSSSLMDVKRIDNGYEIDVNNDRDNGYLFLPINNIPGLKAFVNDREVVIDSYVDNFVSIKLDDGDNHIVIKYEMPLFKLGIIISIIGLIWMFLFRKGVNNHLVLSIIYWIYMGICMLFYIYFYGYSFIKYYR